MKALILAGGFGTRLKDVAVDIPKPMVMIAGKPFLEHQLLYLKDQEIEDIIIAVHHMSNKIKSYFGNGSRWGLDITYSEEEYPLGTAGAIKKAEKYINDTFLVLNGDSYSQIDIKKLLEFHKSKKSNFTISLTKSNNAVHYGSVVLDGSKVKDFIEKKENLDSFVNIGVYMFEPIIFNFIESDKNISIEKEIFPKLAKQESLYGYIHEGYFMDIGRPETYSKFKEDVISSLLLNPTDSIKTAWKKIAKSGINIILITDEKKKLLGVLTDRAIRDLILKGINLDDNIERVMIRDPVTVKTTDTPEDISELLISGINYLPVVDENGTLRNVEFRSEKIKMESFPIVRGKAPLRISFAGGGTDVPYFFEKYGGIVINATIDKYCYATIVKRADSKIIIGSDMGEELIIDSKKDIKYDGNFDLLKAIINIMKPDFGFEIYLRNDIPPGRGLGSSATLAVLVISLLSYLQDLHYDDYKIAELAFKAERDELKIGGGWQDQYAAITGGFSFIEFNKETNIIYPLKLKDDFIHELTEHLLLCYVGKSHYSADIHSSQEKTFFQREEDIVENLNYLKGLAKKIKDCLLTNELDSMGRLLNESWENKRKLSPQISNPQIDYLYEIGMKSGAYGGKLLGAGGGGYVLFLHSPKKRNNLKKALEKAGGEILPFNFDFDGTKIWSVKTKF